MPKSKIDVEAELREVTGVKARSKEDRQDYLIRVLEKAHDLETEEWEGLSQPCQDWINTATKQANADKPISDFPGTKPAAKAEDAEADTDASEEDEDATARDQEAEDDGASEEEQEEDVAAKSARSKKKAAGARKGTKATTKPTKPAAAKKAAPGPRKIQVSGDGVKVRIKKAILAKPDISADELVEKLGKNGSKVSRTTVASVRSEFRHSLAVLRDNGNLKGVDL